MVRSILSKQDIRLLVMALDQSLTEHECNSFLSKIFSRIRSRNLCKHSIAIVISDESIEPHDFNSEIFRPRTQDDIDREAKDFARSVQTAVDHILHQVETKHAAEKAEQAREIAALKEQLSQRCQGVTTAEASDQVQTSHLHESDIDLDVTAGEDNASGDGSERSMTPEAFCERVEDVAGRRHWRTAFAHRLRTTVGALKADLQGDTVPQRLVAMLDTLTTDDLLPASRKHWTAEERVHLSVLLDDGLSDVELAHHLSAEFGRRIFEGSVARQRRRLQRISARGDAGPQCHTDVDRRSVDASIHAAL